MSESLTRIADQLFFIVGAGRSGTTLLQIMLANHPDITVAHETRFYTSLRRKYLEKWGEVDNSSKFVHAIEFALNSKNIKELNLDKAKVRQLCEAGIPSWETIFLAILTNLADKHHTTRIGEKSPAHILHLGLLKDRFQNAKFIHIVRDPRAVVLSQIQLPRYRREYYNILGLCRNWHSKINLHRKYREILGPERYFTLKYEDLVHNPQDTLRSICKFINVEFSLEMLNHHERDFLGFSERKRGHMENTLKPIFTSSIEKWRKTFTPNEISVIEYALLEDMRLFDYKPVQSITFSAPLKYGVCLSYYFIMRLPRKVGENYRKLKSCLKRLPKLVKAARLLRGTHAASNTRIL